MSDAHLDPPRLRPARLAVARLLPSGRELPAAAALLLVCVGLFAAGRVIEARRNTANLRDVTMTIETERLLSALKDVETGERGYLLTGDGQYLQPYELAVPVVRAQVERLAGLGLALDGLPAAVEDEITAARAGIEARRAGGLEGAVRIMATGRGKQSMDTVRARVAEVQAAAVDRAQRRTRQHGQDWLYALGLLTLAGAITAVGAFARRRRRDIRAANTLLQDVLENAPVGLGLLDRSLRIRHMNRALAAMSSRALGAEVGGSMWESMPELRDTFGTKLERVLDGGRPIPNTEVQAVRPGAAGADAAVPGELLPRAAAPTGPAAMPGPAWW